VGGSQSKVVGNRDKVLQRVGKRILSKIGRSVAPCVVFCSLAPRPRVPRCRPGDRGGRGRV
jgi:hypothetical protein